MNKEIDFKNIMFLAYILNILLLFYFNPPNELRMVGRGAKTGRGERWVQQTSFAEQHKVLIFRWILKRLKDEKFIWKMKNSKKNNKVQNKVQSQNGWKKSFNAKPRFAINIFKNKKFN